MSLGNAGVVYGTRGEVFEGDRGKTLSEFISLNFSIEDVFERKLVMGRCICHGKKALETDVLLDSEQAAEKFISSKESKKPHVILIYDKHGDSRPVRREEPAQKQEGNVVISEGQWTDLVSSIKKLELSVLEQAKPKAVASDVVHAYVVCDGCYPTEQEEAVEIHGPRFRCLACPNFDLCSTCESEGFENHQHKKTHNMVKIKSPANVMHECPAKPEQYTTSKVCSNDKEVIIDIAGDRKDLFEMFSKLENLEDVVHGYKLYKKWTEILSEEKIEETLLKADDRLANKSQPCDSNQQENKTNTRSRLEVDMRKKDKAIIFYMHNTGTNTVPGGLTLVYSTFKDDDSLDASNVTCELPIGPHEILPGNDKMLKFNYFGVLSDISMETRSQIALVDVNQNVIFKGTNSGGAGSHFVLESHGMTSPDIVEKLPLLNRCDSFQVLEKDDSDGVISSSTVTNDNDPFRSASDQETSNWEEYDFLSESDV